MPRDKKFLKCMIDSACHSGEQIISFLLGNVLHLLIHIVWHLCNGNELSVSNIWCGLFLKLAFWDTGDVVRFGEYAVRIIPKLDNQRNILVVLHFQSLRPIFAINGRTSCHKQQAHMDKYLSIISLWLTEVCIQFTQSPWLMSWMQSVKSILVACLALMKTRPVSIAIQKFRIGILIDHADIGIIEFPGTVVSIFRVNNSSKDTTASAVSTDEVGVRISFKNICAQCCCNIMAKVSLFTISFQRVFNYGVDIIGTGKSFEDKYLSMYLGSVEIQHTGTHCNMGDDGYFPTALYLFLRAMARYLGKYARTSTEHENVASSGIVVKKSADRSFRNRNCIRLHFLLAIGSLTFAIRRSGHDNHQGHSRTSDKTSGLEIIGFQMIGSTEISIFSECGDVCIWFLLLSTRNWKTEFEKWNIVSKAN